MSIIDYFQKPNASRILLVEVQRNDSVNTKYFMSDSFYITEPSDTPSNLQYSPVIADGGIPALRRDLGDVFRSNASTAFGTINLADETVQFISDSTSGVDQINLVKGAKVDIYLAAPVSLFPRSDAILLMSGLISNSSGDADGNISFEVVDYSQYISQQVLQVTDKPKCWGYVRNIQPVIYDPTTRKYFVNDGPIESIEALYDDGVVISTSDYTTNYSEGSLTLSYNPVGILTADVKGSKPSGVWLTSTEDIISDMLTSTGVSITNTFNLPTGTIGYFTNQSENLDSIFNKLTKGCGGYWLVDRTGVLTFDTFPEVSGLGKVYTEQEIIQGSLQYQSIDELFETFPYSYRNNWTLVQAKEGADAVIGVFMSKNYLEGFSTLASPDSELQYSTAPLTQTYFDSDTDSAVVIDKIKTLYSSPRININFTAPFSNTLSLGDTVTVMFYNKEFTGVVTSVSDEYSSSYPTQKIQVLS